MSKINISNTTLKMIDKAPIEYLEASTIEEKDLEKLIEENTLCVIVMPILAKEYD